MPPATNLFQVGSGFQVQSLLPFKRFVNHICSALSLPHPRRMMKISRWKLKWRMIAPQMAARLA
jgi:hypothetical protein